MRQFLSLKSPVLLLILVYSVHAVSAVVLTDRELRVLQSLSLQSLGAPPGNPSNKFADSENAAEFGQQLFFDPDLSSDGSLSCAGCHEPDKAYTDGKALAKGVEQTSRNTQTLFGVAYQKWFYWDGRRDSLWSQAMIPFEAPSEMGSSRLAVVREVLTDAMYRAQYHAIFGEPPHIPWDELPSHATPLGVTEMQNAWYRLPRTIQRDINGIFANLGKALEAFERTLDPPQTRFDRFINAVSEGKTEKAMEMASREEVQGMKLFIDDQRAQCLRCHNGPMLSNGGFHNIGTGKFSGKSMDFGRVFGLQAVLIDQFNCLGEYSDARPEQCDSLNYLPQDPHQSLYGAFKTPTLRYLNQTEPYFHDGRFDSLEAVIDYYAEPASTGRNGVHELVPLELKEEERQALVAFLKMLGQDKKRP